MSEADAHRTLLPSTPAMTIAGVVSHLRWVEHGWFEVSFLGESDCETSTDDDPLAGLPVDGISLARLVDEYGELTDGPCFPG